MDQVGMKIEAVYPKCAKGVSWERYQFDGSYNREKNEANDGHFGRSVVQHGMAKYLHRICISGGSDECYMFRGPKYTIIP